MKKASLILGILGLALIAQAAIVGPYGVDSHTLHLWHMDEVAVPVQDAVAGGKAMAGLKNGSTLGNSSYSTGLGMAMQNTRSGYLTETTADAAVTAPFALTGADGAFTFEAIIKLDSLAASVNQQHVMSMCGTGPDVFRVRLENWGVLFAMPSAGHWAGVGYPGGDNAPNTTDWFHVAVTYNGQQGQADNVKMYWTKLGPNVVKANYIGANTIAADLNVSVLGEFYIANMGWGHGEGLVGKIDEVRISDIARTSEDMLFGLLSNPQPANGENVNDQYLAQLCWTNAVSIPVCDVYFGKGDANELNYKTKLAKIGTANNQSGQVCVAIPGTYHPLEDSTTYSWAVDCVDPNIPVSIWSFNVTSVPLIQTHPVDQVKFPTETAVFNVTVSSTSPAVYTWYQSTDNANNTPADDTQVGTDSATLTLTGVSKTNEGYYYCSIQNDGGVAKSNTAKLVVKRQMAYWTLDSLVGGQYKDTSGEGHNADPNGTVDMTQDGIKGKSAIVNASTGFARAGTWNPSSISGQLTVSGWVKWDGSTGNQVLVSKANDWQNPGVMWSIACGSNGSLFVMGGSGGPGLPAGTLVAGKWQFVAVTFDGSTARLYTITSDSTANNFTTASSSFAFGNGTDSTVWIGARGSDAVTPAEIFTGGMDEVQIFNYANSVQEIVALYNGSVSAVRNFCVNTYENTYDYNNNCKVDLADFASFADAWLSCGWYPVCP